MSIKLKPEDLVDPKFLGIPYKLHGRDFKGTDCLGLMQIYFKEQNVSKQ